MDDFLHRQLSQIQFSVSDFRNGEIDLNNLVQRLEVLGNLIGGKFWEDRLVPLLLYLESINSELLDKNRDMKPDEENKVSAILYKLEEISNP